MPGRSIAGQKTLIQRETTPGTAAVNAMLQLEALRMRPAFEGDAEIFKGLTGKVGSAVLLPDLRGTWGATAVQCFNAIGHVAASRIDGTPTTTQPDAVNAPSAYQHVFELNPDGEDTKATYTSQYGDATQAMQATYGVFQSLGIDVVRGQLGFTTGFMSREPATGATLATVGVTTVPAVPIPPRGYDVFADDLWADLGTTKLLECYRMNANLGDKFQPDAPINSAISSYESAMEAEDQPVTFEATFGFAAAAVGLISTFKAGSRKFFRLAVTGPIIEDTVAYSLELDWAAFLTGVGEITTAQNSPAVAVPMTMELGRDSLAANSLRLTLVNTVVAYA